MGTVQRFHDALAFNEWLCENCDFCDLEQSASSLQARMYEAYDNTFDGEIDEELAHMIGDGPECQYSQDKED